MLYYFLIPLVPRFHALNVFNYITFRAAGAAVTSILLTFLVGPLILKRLDRASNYQVVREGTPDSHAAKSKTPRRGSPRRRRKASPLHLPLPNPRAGGRYASRARTGVTRPSSNPTISALTTI